MTGKTSKASLKTSIKVLTSVNYKAMPIMKISLAAVIEIAACDSVSAGFGFYDG